MLHFWSLAVEEQFYLLWPVLLLTVARIGRPRLAMATLATAVLAGSFVLSVMLTDTSGAWAYFSLPTRAWQLAAGGLLALGATAARSRATTRSRPRSAGWVRRCWARVSWRSGRRRPIRALPRCCRPLGAVALIASGGVVGSPGWIVLARAPLRWLGRISYSLYLWHWPILVLGPVALGLGMAGRRRCGRRPRHSGRARLLAVALAARHLAARRGAIPSRSPVPRGPCAAWRVAGATALILVLGSTAIGVVGDREVAAAAALDAERRRRPSDESRRRPCSTHRAPVERRSRATPSPSTPGRTAVPERRPRPPRHEPSTAPPVRSPGSTARCLAI